MRVGLVGGCVGGIGEWGEDGGWGVGVGVRNIAKDAG